MTPVIEDRLFNVSHKNAEVMVGSPLTSEQIIESLKRMGVKAVQNEDKNYTAHVPAWRVDVLHECDLLEDIAICYGY